MRLKKREHLSTSCGKTSIVLYPPQPSLDHIIAIKDNEGSNLFDSDEEDDEDNNNVEEFYATKRKADA